MRSLKRERWSTLTAALLGLCAVSACGGEDADTNAEAAIREVGGFVTRDGERAGRPIVAVDLNGFGTRVAVKDKHLREMAPLLAKLKHLEKLQLDGSFVTDAGMKDVAKLKQLRTLSLGITIVSDAGLKELAALEKLESLIFSKNGITGTGLRHLAGLQNLKSLSLRGLPLTDAGMRELAALKHLRRLDLGKSSMNDEGVKRLAGLKQLTWLDLSITKVTDAGLKDLAGHENLRTLRLYQTRVTVAAINALQQALPHCRMEITGESKDEPLGGRAALLNPLARRKAAMASGSFRPLRAASPRIRGGLVEMVQTSILPWETRPARGRSLPR